MSRSNSPPTYARQTVIAAADMLKALGHTGFDRFLLELELLDENAGKGSGLLARATSLAEYAIKNPTVLTPERRTVPYAIIRRATDLWREGVAANLKDNDRDKFEAAMKREGQGLALEGGHNAIPQALDAMGLGAAPLKSPGYEVFAGLFAKSKPSPKVQPKGRKVFIVHGHDEAPREAVARFLAQINFEPIILHEQVNKGRTLIEKFESNSDVGFVVVLLTPDDLGGRVDGAQEHRVRQNVLLE